MNSPKLSIISVRSKVRWGDTSPLYLILTVIYLYIHTKVNEILRMRLIIRKLIFIIQWEWKNIFIIFIFTHLERKSHHFYYEHNRLHVLQALPVTCTFWNLLLLYKRSKKKIKRKEPRKISQWSGTHDALPEELSLVSNMHVELTSTNIHTPYT